MKYLLKTTEVFRVATETEAKNLIEEAKKSRDFVLAKYLCEARNQKQKGEIIDEWYRVTLVKCFNEEKEPDTEVAITYNAEAGFFPDPVVDSEDEE